MQSLQKKSATQRQTLKHPEDIKKQSERFVLLTRLLCQSRGNVYLEIRKDSTTLITRKVVNKFNTNLR